MENAILLISILKTKAKVSYSEDPNELSFLRSYSLCELAGDYYNCDDKGNYHNCIKIGDFCTDAYNILKEFYKLTEKSDIIFSLNNGLKKYLDTKFCSRKLLGPMLPFHIYYEKNNMAIIYIGECFPTKLLKTYAIPKFPDSMEVAHDVVEYCG